MAEQLMKGHTFKDALQLVRGKPRFEYPIMVEAKADEIRCQIFKENGDIHYASYSGKPLYNLAFLTPAVELLFKDIGISELDVGIQVNGNFNDSYRWTQSSSGEPKEKFDRKTQKTSPALFTNMVQVIVFDIPQSRKPYVDRIVDIDFAAAGLRHYGVDATRPTRALARSEAEVWGFYNVFREQGLEGAMGKTLGHVYSRRRTFDWMKIKPSEDHDGQITGFNEAVSEQGEPLGRVGSINVTCADGSTAAPSGIPHDLGRELWKNQSQYIGQWIEFYCMERDRAGGYRHPIYHRFREDK